MDDLDIVILFGRNGLLYICRKSLDSEFCVELRYRLSWTHSCFLDKLIQKSQLVFLQLSNRCLRFVLVFVKLQLSLFVLLIVMAA